MTCRCPHHAQCRADNELPADMLCGYHHARTWGWCGHWRDYEYKARLAKAQAMAKKRKAAETVNVQNESIDEAIREMTV